jgi:hypothetical protein
MRNEHLYRDALAIQCGGAVEVLVGRDKIDVLRPVCDSVAEVIEVKYAAGLREAMGQAVTYSRRYARANPGVVVSRRVHLICGATMRSRSAEAARIAEHREEMEEDGITLTTVFERPGLTPVYRAGGLEFGSAQALRSHLARVKRDFLLANFLSPFHEVFLRDLANAWRRVELGKAAHDVRVAAPRTWGFVGMMMSVHGRVVSPDDCVRPLMMLTHYELLSEPLAA